MFYERTAFLLGTSRISHRDRRRAALIDTFTAGSQRVVELGAGFGGSAAAVADLGHSVVAIERSPARAALCRRHASDAPRRRLEIVEADFNTIEIAPCSFDIATYWSGFGEGDDQAQLTLLKRVRRWLKPASPLFLDVFDPSWWAANSGRINTRNGLCEELGFDELRRRLCISHWLSGRRQARITHSIRCYDEVEVMDLANAAGFVLGSIVKESKHAPHTFLVQLDAQ